MTRHDPKAKASRGGAPVGLLSELPAVELGAVLFLRQWCGGDAAREVIARDFTLVFGADRGAMLTQTHDAVMRLVLGQSRRPLMRHAEGCPCLGGDESAFAQMVAAAGSGDVEDATLFAMTLISSQAVPRTVVLAEHIGLAFAEMLDPLSKALGQGYSLASRRH